MIGAIVLAAGSSSRMGPVNKLVQDVGGEPMVTRVVDAALTAGAHPVLLVVSGDDTEVSALVSDRSVRVVRNRDPSEGIASSIRAGLEVMKEARPSVTGALVCLGDMPLVRSSTLRSLMDALPPRVDARPVVPVHDGRRGNPVLWPAVRFPSLLKLEGDVGARALLDRVAPIEVEVDDPGVVTDADDPAELEDVRGVASFPETDARGVT